MKSLSCVSGLWVVGCLLGCAAATTVQLPVHLPPELDVAGIRTIAVVDFEGPALHAHTARHEIATALQQRCDVPDPTITRDFLPASIPYAGYGIDVPRLINQARQAGFDAVLLGKVDYTRENAASTRIGNPTLAVKIETQLIDVRSGDVLGKAQSEHKWKGKLATIEGANDSEHNVTTALTLKAARDIIGQLNGTTRNLEVVLAAAESTDDADKFKQGTQAAEAGEWSVAAEQFRQAIAANPSSHAAYYNLGVACEAQHDYRTARSAYQQALAQNEEPVYRNALARVDLQSQRHAVSMRPNYAARR